MIALHTYNTPNGRKISVALEEMGLEYNVHPVNISKNEQFAPIVNVPETLRMYDVSTAAAPTQSLQTANTDATKNATNKTIIFCRSKCSDSY